MKKIAYLCVMAAFFAVSCEKGDEMNRPNVMENETRADFEKAADKGVLIAVLNEEEIDLEMYRINNELNVYYTLKNPELSVVTDGSYYEFMRYNSGSGYGDLDIWLTYYPTHTRTSATTGYFGLEIPNGSLTECRLHIGGLGEYRFKKLNL